MSQQSSQLLRARHYDDVRYSKKQAPPSKAPNWSLKKQPQSSNSGNFSQIMSDGRNYDASLYYNAEEEHQRGESSTTGMIRGALKEAETQIRHEEVLQDDLPPYLTDDEESEDDTN